MGLRRVVPSLLILAAVAMWPVAALPQDAPREAAPAPSAWDQMRVRFHGTWRLTVTHAAARQNVDAAIEQAVGAMNYFVRGVARDQLRDNTPLNRRIDLLFEDGERINVRFDDRFSYTTRMGRTTRFTTPEGDDMRVTQRFRGEQLEQVFATDAGTRWNVYTSTGDGQLRVEATTQGMMMPQPLYFTLEYRRE
jgi:hypothetical protein